jgi:hypothetical protein
MAVFKDVQDIADSMDSLVKIANFLAHGSWTPQIIVRAYLTYGIKYGWNIAQTMENLHVMQGGKLAYQVHAFIGLVLSSGKADRIDTVESTDRLCTIECKRRDSKTVHRITFTIEMAQQANLTKSPNWQKMPKQMLQARCRTMALREVFADVISGYDAVEMIDSAWDMTEEEKVKAMDEVQDTAIAESVAHEKMKADRRPGTKKAGADVSHMPQPVQVQPVQVQPVQVQPVQVQPVQSPPIGQEPLFPSDQKKAIEQQAYRDRDLDVHRWRDADMDEDDVKDWRESWKVK